MVLDPHGIFWNNCPPTSVLCCKWMREEIHISRWHTKSRCLHTTYSKLCKWWYLIIYKGIFVNLLCSYFLILEMWCCKSSPHGNTVREQPKNMLYINWNIYLCIWKFLSRFNILVKIVKAMMVILSCPYIQICDDANTLKEQVKNTSYIIMGKYT